MKGFYTRFAASLATRSRALRQDRRAVTALEYGIIASALAFVLITAFTNLGTPLSTIFTKVASSL